VIQSNSLIFSKDYASPETIKKDGLIVVCVEDDAACLSPSEALLSQDAIREKINLTGFNGVSLWRIALFIQKPKI
jgi:hypothetical protein